MFKREIILKLEKWAADKYRKPLVLRGARQVGKTTVVNEFGKSFENYLYLNLENPEAVRLFENPLSMSDLLTLIYLHCSKDRAEGRVLVFIDEIQNSPKAVARLRYFYEELPDVYVIAAGSLLESLIDTHISFPVGRVEYMALRPCSFREFLGAIGEERLTLVLSNPSLSIAFHDRLMALFAIYALIGGMPEVVERYASQRDVVALNGVYETLLQGYRDDVEKYAKRNTQLDVIRYILNAGWAKAGQTITLGNFGGSNYRAREVGDAFRTLEKTLILELVYPVVETSLPVISDMKRAPKLIWLDTGLVNYAAGIQKEVFGATDIMDAWRGMLAEQVVAQELLTLSDKVSQKRNFWMRNKEGAKAEVDFIWIHDSTIFPIEVKSGHNAHLRSIHSFMEQSPYTVAIRVWAQPYSVDKIYTASGKEFSLMNVPFYQVGFIPELLTALAHR